MGLGGKADVQTDNEATATTTNSDGTTISWDEIEKHTAKNDRWFVIDNKVYNVTKWLKHPGGQAVLNHYAGQDATEAFRAFHRDIPRVQKYLKHLYVGDVENTTVTGHNDTRNKLAHNIENLKLKEDFEELRQKAQEMAQTGWLQHDFGHLSVFSTSKWNHLLHQFYIGFVKIDKDPDVRIESMFLIGNIAKKNAKYGKKMPYNFQQFYFFVAAPLLFPLYFQFMTIRHVFVRRKWTDLSWMVLFYIKLFTLLTLKLGFLSTIKYLFLLRLFESTWFAWVAQSNHVVMDILEDKSNLSWVRMQLQATCNIDKSIFNDWFTGHLNFQIEHHLFPTMPRHNLYKIQPLVKSLCEKYNIKYVCKPMMTAFIDIFLSLEKSGRLWHESYMELKMADDQKQLFKIDTRKRIALVAHDNKKIELIEWIKRNREILKQHDLCATGTTGKLIENELGLPVTKYKSGPLGGDQQLGAKIAEGLIDILIFISDSLEPQPHDSDVKALLRLANVWNIPTACNLASADFILTSPYMSSSYTRVVDSFENYFNRSIVKRH
ncbi:unnamed protein product [Didymodactylos carnosus]|uniref:Methylglyoxal synthase n=1 Tax=Didymodactylos carnosus TaxID=1234261 RepID=A0A813PGH1_9BILA|nr:unnamed protein product [Didymodactylos carnosus]CAF0754650.1 unnamed protein product [Didymodactylos carnosus]CAF3496708.1 unnamed protein product [Didymodactylos carnosus]CAF3534859.1 unnamed protein product [Didymodactylos carnosus]